MTALTTLTTHQLSLLAAVLPALRGGEVLVPSEDEWGEAEQLVDRMEEVES